MTEEPEIQNEKPHKRKRKVLRFVVPVALILSVPSALIYGPSLIRFKIIREPILAVVNGKIPGKVELGGIRFSVPLGILELRDLDCITSDGISALSVKLLKIRLNPKELFDNRIHVTEIRLTKPQLNLQIDQSGMVNLVSVFVDSLAPADTTKPAGAYPPNLPFTIAIDTIIIDSLSGRFAMDQPKLSVDFGSLSVHGKTSLFPVQAQLKLEGSEIIYSDSKMKIETNQLNLFYTGTDSAADSVDLFWKTPNETVAIRGKVGGWMNDSIAIHTKVEGGFSLATIKELSGADIGDGTFLVDCQVDGTIGNPTIHGYLGYRGHSLAGTGINLIDLPVNLTDRIVSTPKGKLTRNDGTVVHNVELTVGLQEYFPHGFTKPLGDLNTLWYRGGASGYSPKIPETDLPLAENYLDVTVDGKGCSLETLDLNGTIAYRTVGSQNGQSVPLRLNGSVAMKNQKIGFNQVNLFLDNQQVLKTKGSVNLKSESMELGLNFSPVSLAKIKPFVKGGFPVDGTILGTVDLNGKYASPEVAYNLVGSSMVVQNYPLGEVKVHGSVSPKSGLVYSKGTIRGAVGNLDFDFGGELFSRGSFSLKKNPLAKLSAVADSRNLFVLSDSAVEGSAHGALSYSGWIGSGSGHFSAQVDSVKNAQFMIPKIVMETEIFDSLITVQNLAVNLYDSVNISAAGTYHLSGLYDFTLDADTIEPRYFVPSIPEDPKILLVANGTAKGSIKNPAADISLVIPDLVWNEISIGTQNVRAILANNQVDLSGSGIADLSGFYELKSTNFYLESTVNRFFLDPYFSAFGQKSLMGSLDGKIIAKGNAKGLDTAIVTIPSLTIKKDSMDLVDGEAATISYGKNGLVIDTLSVKLMNHGFATISGTMTPDQTMDFSFRGNAPLAIAEQFTESIERVHGDITLSGSVKGTPKLPLIEASANFDSVSMILADSQQKLHGLTGGILYRGDRFEVDKLRANLDDGSFEADGSINLKNNKAVSGDFRAKLFNLPILIPEIADIRLGGDLRFVSDSVKQGVIGTLDLLECFYYQDIQPLPKLDSAPKKMAVDSPKQASPMDNTALSIRLIPRNNIYVENNLATFEIHPELTVGGTISNPLLEGRMDIVSGDLSYLNRKFTVKSGTIEFINPDKNEPDVHIVAETSFFNVINGTTWNITLSVDGIVGDELLYKFESSPALQDNEIIALILTGNPSFTEGINFDATEFLMNQLSAATKERLGVDVQVDLKNSSVKIGDQINRRIFTDYEVIQEGSEMKQIASVLIKLFDQLNIRGFAGSKGAAGGEVQIHGKIR